MLLCNCVSVQFIQYFYYSYLHQSMGVVLPPLTSGTRKGLEVLMKSEDLTILNSLKFKN